MKDYQYYIEHLNMTKHPEGGYYALTYTSPFSVNCQSIDNPIAGKRPLATSIYFLIHDQDVSNFHSLKSDEMWYFHDGAPLTIAVISTEGHLTYHKLGLDLEKGEKPQILVPAGSIFGSYTTSGYALVGCMVSCGFDFQDFNLYQREELLLRYPQHEAIIRKLTQA